MARVSVSPYQQGHLDGLCAYYSIVNAIALIAARAQANKVVVGRLRGRLARSRVDDLLAALTATTPAFERKAGYAISNGITPSELNALIEIAGRWLRKQYQVTLRVRRPFYRRAKMSREQFVRLARTAASQGASAIIIEGRFPWNHWSVAMEINERGVKLLDSSGYRLVVWKKRGDGMAPGFDLLVPRSVTVISVSAAK